MSISVTPTTPDTRKSVLVTGAGVGGIGGALALEFHRAGFRVFAGARRAETIAPLVALGIESVSLDVTSNESIAAAVAHISELTDGKLDMLVNNAGAAAHVPALDLDVDGVVRNMFEVNVFGVMRMVKAFSGMLIKAEGCIVNIGSIAPIVPLVFSSAYNATKAALHAYGDCLRIELAPFNVQVTTVITGGVKSNIVRETDPQLPKGSLYEPIREFWLKRVKQSQNKPMETELYARGVVKALMKHRKPIWFWYGAFAKLAWWIYHFTGKSWRDLIMARWFGFNKLKVIAAQQKKARQWQEMKRKAGLA